MRVQLEQATFLEVDDERYGPGEVVEVEDEIGKALVSGGSAREETVV